MEKWNKIEEIVERALACAPDQRSALIERACCGDLALQAEVQSLLKACESAGDFLEQPALASDSGPPSGTHAEVSPPMPTAIGQFRINKVLGYGGMGIVYLAEQARPRRLVALKVIKPGLVTPATLRRFEHEAEILARLQHPGIAQIYEVGTAETGGVPHPYFAMELVEGQSITEFVKRRGLHVNERVRLMILVCDAVHHAHQKGVIHRDLKPANILVDENGQPKILDFGVARATTPDRQPTLQTSVGQLIGTLGYLSPEQATGDPMAIDVRSDVYALGVVAYEILAGRAPFDLSDQPILDAVRIIREQDPKRLSSFNRSLRGDLDTIVATALDKDAGRRYQSAAELGADFRRYLQDEPIVARPPSARYQISKFAKRHRPLVIGSGVVVLILALATVTLSAVVLALRKANTELSTERNAVKEAHAVVEAQLVRANGVIDFLNRMFASLQPQQRGRHARLHDFLNDAALVIDREFEREPQLAAELHLIVGNGFRAINEIAFADQHLRKAHDLVQASNGASGDLADDIRIALAGFEAEQGNGDHAINLLSDHIANIEHLHGPAHRLTLAAKLAYATALQKVGHFEEAVVAARNALAAAGQAASLESSTVVELQLLVAADPIRENQLHESVRRLRSLFEDARAKLGPTHRTTLVVAAKWGGVVFMADQWKQRLQQAGSSSPQSGPPLTTPEEAVVVLRALVDEALRQLGTPSFEVQAVMLVLSRLLFIAGDPDGALTMTRDVWQAQEALLGDGHALPLMTRYEYARSLLQHGDLRSAGALLHRGFLVSEVALGRDHDLTRRFMESLTAVQKEQDAANAKLVAARLDLIQVESTFGKNSPNALAKMYDLLGHLQEEGRWLETESLARDIVERCRQAYGPDDPQTGQALSQHGYALAMLGWIEQADSTLVRAYDILASAEGQLALTGRRNVLQLLAVISETKGNIDRAKSYRDALAAIAETGPHPLATDGPSQK
jgi:non-specific serine/threonine protein kinase/serine/threonine-protein kinase